MTSADLLVIFQLRFKFGVIMEGDICLEFKISWGLQEFLHIENEERKKHLFCHSIQISEDAQENIVYTHFANLFKQSHMSV